MLEIQQQHGKVIEQKGTEHKKESGLRAVAWFLYLREMVCMENLCRIIGFNERQTATLISGKPLEYEGKLYSKERKRKFTTEKADFQG